MSRSLTPKAIALLLLGTAVAACSNDSASTSTAADTAAAAVETAAAAVEPEVCVDMGPQTPRDITSIVGTNPTTFDIAPPPSELNLCNIHSHTNAEHKGPGFSVFVNATDRGGYACNNTDSLTAAELAPAPGAYGGVVPGETIEVHWVHTSCGNAAPGEGLGACVPEGCTDPALRVETQVFLVVNDENALDFTEFGYAGSANDAGLHQAKALPSGTGDPIQFLGSTTGPSWDQKTCSPAQVTWNVRPQCAKVDINSLHSWAENGNPFKETDSHGVRQLVTDPRLLSPIGG